MDKKALEKKLREIQKAICLQVGEEHFEALHKDVEDWEAWGKLHAWADAMGADPDYVLLIQECTMATARLHLGDKA